MNPVKALLNRLFYSDHFHQPIVRIYGLFKPPPYKLENSEFHQGLWHTISTFHGIKCRPLGENNTYPIIYKENTSTEHKRCKFAGTRYGKEINMSSLRDVTSVWNESLQFTVALRERYIEHRQLADKRFNLRQAFIFSKIGAALPAYLARKTDMPVKNGRLPPIEQAFFSLGVGVMVMIETLMENGEMIVLNEKPMTGDELADLAERSGALISDPKDPDSKVCAGSPSAIKSYLDVLMNGEFKIDDYSADVQRALAGISDEDRFYDYLYATCRMELYARIGRYICEYALFIILQNQETLTLEQHGLWIKCEEHTKDRNNGVLKDPEQLSSMIQITLALLGELNDSKTSEILKNNELFNGTKFIQINSGSPAQNISNLTNKIISLLFDQSKEELDIINRQLKRVNNKPIKIMDMYNRIYSMELKQLFESFINQK